MPKAHVARSDGSRLVQVIGVLSTLLPYSPLPKARCEKNLSDRAHDLKNLGTLRARAKGKGKARAKGAESRPTTTGLRAYG